jgi:hypothetical protein
MKVLLSIALGLIVAYAVTRGVGAWYWERETQSLVTQLHAAHEAGPKHAVDLRAIEGLPPPVQRYFRAVLRDGQPMVTAARVSHEGSFNMSESGQQWKPFTSGQWIRTRRPGFVWDGRIFVAPGLPFHVHDAYVAGTGILHATALGLVGVMNVRGTPELARGEFMRYVAEAPLVPTALLPGPGVTWTAIDDSTAQVTIADGAVSATLQFRFAADGFVVTVTARARGRTVNGKVIETPWQGRWWGYELRGGMRVPTQGEVAWMLPDGPHPYWRGKLTSADYEFER